jgi:peptidyl-prolyl cis-trans isomerase SurA
MNIKQFLILIFCIIVTANLNITKAQPSNADENKIIDRVVAVVGNQVVLQSEIEEQFLQVQARGMRTTPNQRCEIFEQLLFQKLLVVQAQIDSVEVTDKQVEAEIDGRLKSYIQQAGGPDELEKYFGKSIPEIKVSFFDPIKDQLIANKMQAEITKDIKITPSEVKKFFTTMPQDSLPVIDATYEFAQIAKKPQMTEEDKNKQREKLTGIRNRIINGEDFKTLAVLYSDDPGSSRNGGLMTGVSRSDLVPEFSSVVFNMEIGEVSDIVETEFGMHVIKLEGRQGDKVDFRHILLIPKISSSEKIKAKNFLDSLANVIRTDTLKFSQAAMLYSDDETTRLNGGELVNPNTGTASFSVKDIEPSITYILKTLKPGEISEAFEPNDQTGLSSFKIVYLKNFVKAHTLNMKDDYQLIQDMALNDKKDKEIKRWVREKQSEIFIKIEGMYKKCKFDFPGWLK